MGPPVARPLRWEGDGRVLILSTYTPAPWGKLLAADSKGVGYTALATQSLDTLATLAMGAYHRKRYTCPAHTPSGLGGALLDVGLQLAHSQPRNPCPICRRKKQ